MANSLVGPKNGNKRWEYDYQNGRMTKVLLRKNK